jgi:hypothetical protein
MMKVPYVHVWKHQNETALYNSYMLFKKNNLHRKKMYWLICISFHSLFSPECFTYTIMTALIL